MMPCDTDLIGLDSLHGPGDGRPVPYEVQAPRHRADAGAQGSRGRGFRGRRPLHQRAGGRRRGFCRRPRDPGGAVGAAAARPGARARGGGGGRMTPTVRDLAHARAGDKGHGVNISVVAHDEAGYRAAPARADRGRASPPPSPRWRTAPCGATSLPGLLGAFNFVIERVRGGGVTATAALDIHGKSLSARSCSRSRCPATSRRISAPFPTFASRLTRCTVRPNRGHSPTPSCPDLFRASSRVGPGLGAVVDGRDKPGHDVMW